MVDRMIFRRLAASRKSALILGPRQTGKSTLCRGLNPGFVANLADEGEYLRYAKDPALLGRIVGAMERKAPVFVDEVQRVPALLNVVQAIMDRPGAPRFLLTGSSARKLRRGGANLLPGRVILEHLDPLSALELGGALNLGRALQVGMLPGVYLDEPEGHDVLSTYVETYLREEVRAEALTRDLGGFARFLDSAAIESGKWINYSKLSSDTEIPKETVRRYYSLLEDTLLIFRLPPFKPRLKLGRRILQHDRFVFFDLGVRNALLGLHRRPLGPDQVGPAFEQWMICQVAYINRALRKDWLLSSYRTDGGAEVDLVIETDTAVIGVEVKAGRGVRATDCRGLQSLAETVGRYKKVEKYIVYGGTERQALSDVKVVPWLPFLRHLAGLA